MRAGYANAFICLTCGGRTALEPPAPPPSSDVAEAVLCCAGCDARYPVRGRIPRFVPEENYASSFGFQWNKYATTQVDMHSGHDISRERFFNVTGWSRRLEGRRMLEAGCGSGRFTQIALETGAEVYSFDYSSAVEANLRNNGTAGNLCLFQADIYNIPLEPASFDNVFCFGVLQHCPDPKGAFMSLVRCLRPGGSIAVDVYDFGFRTLVNPKYWLRPITRRMSSERLYKAVSALVPRLFPLKMWMTEKLPFGKYPAFFIPVAYHKGFIPGFEKMSYEELVEWSTLDTFDKFAPRYDRPQTMGAVKRWFAEAGLKDVDVRFGPNGIIGRAVRGRR